MCTIDGCGDQQDMPPIEVSETDRRAFMAGVAALPLATVLAYPDLARAQADRLQEISIPTDGILDATGFIAMPDVLPAPAIILVHEWWGLNDQIKAVAAEYAALGYIAMAIDLYDGEVAADGGEALSLMQNLDPSLAREQMAAAINHLRGLEDCTGKIGTVGWCFGGGWSLRGSLVAPVDATVIYYGDVTPGASVLASLSGPVLGHFGTQDGSIDAEMVGGFEAEMAKAGKADGLEVHWYDANHAFANPTGSRYDAEDAALAWERTLQFFATNLGV